MMTSAQVVETSANVITNSPSQEYTHPGNHDLPTDNFSGPTTILGVQYSRIATKFLLFLKLNFNLYNFFKHIAKFALIIAIS